MFFELTSKGVNSGVIVCRSVIAVEKADAFVFLPSSASNASTTFGSHNSTVSYSTFRNIHKESVLGLRPGLPFRPLLFRSFTGLFPGSAVYSGRHQSNNSGKSFSVTSSEFNFTSYRKCRCFGQKKLYMRLQRIWISTSFTQTTPYHPWPECHLRPQGCAWPIRDLVLAFSIPGFFFSLLPCLLKASTTEIMWQGLDA